MIAKSQLLCQHTIEGVKSQEKSEQYIFQALSHRAPELVGYQTVIVIAVFKFSAEAVLQFDIAPAGRSLMILCWLGTNGKSNSLPK